MTAKHYLKIAHRGASAYEPENSLRAFRRAIALGADMSELDVHMSSDGHIIVLHNDAVETTGGRRLVAGLTLQQLQQIDIGEGECIPTLQSVITAVRGRGGLYIELKGDTTPRPVADLLRANQFTERSRVIAGSFKLPLLRDMKDYAPEIATSVLVGPVFPAAELVKIARSVDADFVHLCWEKRAPEPHTLVAAELLATLHAAGLGVMLWHEERPAEIAALTAMDIDGICGNAPDLL